LRRTAQARYEAAQKRLDTARRHLLEADKPLRSIAYGNSQAKMTVEAADAMFDACPRYVLARERYLKALDTASAAWRVLEVKETL
jgi:hypothetical protein